MARLGRYFVADQPLHVIQRGNNRSQIFFTQKDATTYLTWLADAAQRNGLAVHAYVLMPNHIHLLATPATPDSLPKTMQSVGRRYVGFFNGQRDRTGTLWEGRYRATVIDAASYFFHCSRYIELNPVRANLASTPAMYRWSSYRANATGQSDPLVTPHALYGSLADSDNERRAAYAALFDEPIALSTLDEIRDATNRGWALGSEAFQTHVGESTGRRARPLPKGRIKVAAEEPPSPDFLAAE